MFSEVVVAAVAVTAIAVVYATFDVFNNRNVPTVFAYASVAVGIVFTLLTLNELLIAESAAIALVISGAGYLLYKSGQLGGADVLEFAAISLIIPYLQTPFYSGAFQYNIPFIVSVFIASGIAALMLIPIYYVPRAARILKKPLPSYVTSGSVLKGVTITAAYVAFMIFLFFFLGANTVLIGLLAVIAVSSLSTILLEKPITDSMVQFITPKQLEDQDIVALNLMSKTEISGVKKKAGSFGKLVTNKTIRELKTKAPNIRLPIYRSAMPMALPILIGVIVSLLVGNLLLYLF